MAKANKGKGSAAVAATPVQAVVQATSNNGLRATWQGYSLCGLLRAMGYAGFTAKQGSMLLPHIGLGAASSSTVGCQVGAGRQYANGVANPHHKGSIVPLTGSVLAAVVALVGQPANPHATTAPLPTKPVAVAPVAAPTPAAPVTVQVPNGKGGKQAVAVTPAVAAVLAGKGKGRKGK